MSGDPSNARLWADADVYVSFDLEAENPTDAADPFGSDWDLVGLLDGDDGFTDTRDEDTGDKFAWGGILMRTSRRNFKQTKTFSALEDNETTFRLRWPGSTDEQIVVPSGSRVERVKLAFETRDGAVVHRLISAYQAEVTVDGDVEENETDIAKVPFVATIFPDAEGVLWIPQNTAVVSE